MFVTNNTGTRKLMTLPPEEEKYAISKRWTPRLARSFVPISTYFLDNYHRLAPHEGAKGLSSSEVMLIIHLMSHKWDEEAPYPSQETLATKMDLSDRRIRQLLSGLVDQGFLRVENRPYQSNLHHLDPLFEALERLMDEDERKATERS